MSTSHPYDSKPWLSAYAPGVPPQIDEITQTLPDMIEASISEYAEKVALEFFGAPTTYTELGDQIAGGAGRAGVVPQQRVAHDPSSLVEGDHAVLLPTDRPRLDAVEAAGIRDRGLQRGPPRLGVDARTVRMRGAPLAHDHT